MCEYDPSQDVSRAPPAPKPNDASAPSPSPASPAVVQLVKQHPPAVGQCVGEEAAFAAASGALIRSIGGLAVGAPTVVGAIPAVLGFIGSAIVVGATAARLANCHDELAGQSKTK
jgi:hypothetical protein